MTQTQRKPATHKIELASNQVYLKSATWQENPIQILVSGYADWTYREWSYSPETTLYYKGHHFTTFQREASGMLISERPIVGQYTTLAEAIEHYTSAARDRLAMIESWNKEDGLEEWCIRKSFTPTSLPFKLTLPLSERKRIERLARYKGLSVDHLILKVLYASLPEIEEHYNDYCIRYPEERECEEETTK